MVKKYKYIIIIFLVSIISLSTYLIGPFKNNHDTKFHVINTLEVKAQIEKDFIYGNKIVGGIANDFGYGTRLFYPPLGHTSIAYIDLVVNDIEISFKIFNVIILFASGVTMFFLVKKLSLDDKVALISSLIYMLAAYHLSDILIRDALNETLVFIVTPMILNGIYSLFYNEGKNFYPLFVCGYALGILSHATMMMYFTFLIGIFLILNIKKVFTKKIFFKLLNASLLALGITSFFWVGMLEQSIFGDYRVFQEGVMVEGTQGNGLFLFEYFLLLSHHDFEIRFFTDITVLILLVITIFKFKKIDNPFYKWVIILGCISIFMSTVVFPWDIFPKSLRVIQFPWRMVTYSTLFIAIIAPLCLKNIKNNKIFYLIAAFLIINSFISFYDFEKQNFVNLEVENLENIETHYEVAMGWQKEYLPVNTYEYLDYFNTRNNEILVIEGQVYTIINETPYLKFVVNEKSTIELPRLYYYGYSLTDENKNKYEINENEKGFIEVTLEPGIYELDYTGSNLLQIADVISILTLLAFGGLKWKKLV